MLANQTLRINLLIKLISILVVAILITDLEECQAQEAPTKDKSKTQKEAIEETVSAFFDAIYNYNYDSVRRITTTDFELVEDTVLMNTSEFIELGKSYEKKGATIRYELVDFNTEVKNSVGWTRWKNKADLTMGDKESDLRFLESAILIKTEDGWKIDRLHSTPIHGR